MFLRPFKVKTLFADAAYSYHLLMSYIVFLIAFTATSNSVAQEKLDWEMLSEASHNEQSFTQGLYLDQNLMYESSGLYGRSFVSIYDVDNNTPLKTLPLPGNVFAEGLTLVNKVIYVLTWREHSLLRFDAKSLKPLTPLRYSEQGWGLTHDGKQFIMSDGSAKLYFRNTETFAIEREIVIKNSWRKYSNLNELEYVDGYIYSNIWQSPYILKIEPTTGAVVGIADFSELVGLNSRVKNHTVLNGIAYDEEQKAFWVTGKLWKKRYLIRFKPSKNAAKKPNQE